MTLIKPAVKRNTLLLLSGLMWTAVGIFLNFLAIHWVLEYGGMREITLIAPGILTALIIARFGFGRIAQKNIKRILAYPQHVCVFAFQEWRSYFLVAIMMAMGIFLRTSGLVPRFILIPLYTAIGTALFLASLIYFRNYYRQRMARQQV